MQEQQSNHVIATRRLVGNLYVLDKIKEESCGDLNSKRLSSTALDNNTVCNKSNVFISNKTAHQIFIVNDSCIKSTISLNSTDTSFKIWHQRLGHASGGVFEAYS